MVLLKIFACVTVFSSVLFGSDWSAYLGPLRNGVSQDKNLLSSFPNEGPEILWRASMGVGWSAPVISDDLLYITSYEDNNKEVVLCLNAITGKEIWKRLDGKKSLKTIIDELVAEFEAPKEEIEKDVLGLTEELLKRQMLTIAS